jgi:hypothetical protein
MKTNHVLSFRRAKTILLLISTGILLAGAPGARADSPSDLMEQGIYSEETTGDLNSAVQLYQKVIAQAKTDQKLAAQAQYHLGLCYYKQKNYTDANTAFETLVKDYPNETDLVAKARQYLEGAHPLQPAPWSDGEDLRLAIRFAGGLKIGVADYRVCSGQTNGQNIWRCTSHSLAAGTQSTSHVEVDSSTMSPIHSLWKLSMLGEVDAVYSSNNVVLTTVGKEGTQTVNFDSPVIDNEEAVEWMRRLPLAQGYKIDQSIFSSLVAKVVPITWTVSGTETVAVPAGTFDCFRVALSIGQTFWYSSDTNRYLVKFEANGVIAELTQISHAAPGELAAYSDVARGFSLTSPPGWFFDQQEVDTKGRSKVTIVDPDGSSDSSLTVVSMDILKPEEKKSLKDYADLQMTNASKMYENFQTRAWNDRTLAGQPAVSAIADFTQGKTKKTAYGVWSFGPTNAVYFEMLTATKDFDAIKPKMDAIIDSYQTL